MLACNLGFLYFWGIVFFITTTLVWFLKREKAQENEDHASEDAEQNLSIVESYKQLLKIFKLPAIQWTVVVLLTCKVFLIRNRRFLKCYLIFAWIFRLDFQRRTQFPVSN